ncbi:MAG: PKD domain-containing protein [Gammaproteobacteria bacterium]|nr:PKD domain-containing protein [Gammaproteobacteria bacterium]
MRISTSCRVHAGFVGILLLGPLLLATASRAAQPQRHAQLTLRVDAQRGEWSVGLHDSPVILQARSAAEIDSQWLRSSDYPRHAEKRATFSDALGSGSEWTVTCSGLPDRPDLIYRLRLYPQHSYATLQVSVRNTTARELHVQALRALEALGPDILDLHGPAAADRVLSDSFSEDWPALKIYDLGAAPAAMHRGVGSQLIYNRESGRSFFVGALSSERFLTLLHLQAQAGAAARIAAFSVDSTGTTEIQRDFDLKNSPAADQVILSLPLAPGAEMAGEPLLLAAGTDYRGQLASYGEAVRALHGARVSAATPIGWWSWTAFYAAINQGETLANADWLAQHLEALGYRYFQVDEGYQYARGEYTTSNAVQFPDGMRAVGQRVTADGLTFGVWTGVFEVTRRAWVYQHHTDWLVKNARGEPIVSGEVFGDRGQHTDPIYSLDTTNPAAQEYLRQTYRSMVREWNVRFIKLDFMDTTAIEGYRYRPNTTALEAQRIGLQIVREAVGEDVILDKDGSPMLNAVGLVDTGRISQDTGHSFEATREAAAGIAARFYMHRNFFVNDPDAFNLCPQQFADDPELKPVLPLAAAEASIALAAVSGGMYEIGDDLPTLGSQRDRLALVENQDLLNMAKLGRASTPVDLLTYRPEDEQPSVFFLKESARQSILTVFNWTSTARSRTVSLADLGLPADHAWQALDVLHAGDGPPVTAGTLQLVGEAPQSVTVLKLIDRQVPQSAPRAAAQVPATAGTGETVRVAARAVNEDAPIVDYRWDFGDGTSAQGPRAAHAYTRPADYLVRLTTKGVEGGEAALEFHLAVTGVLRAFPDLSTNRRGADALP